MAVSPPKGGWGGYSKGTYLVVKLYNDTLSHLWAYSLHRLQHLIIAFADDASQFLNGQGGENHPGNACSDAAHTGQQEEEFALGLRAKTPQLVGILANRLGNPQLDFIFSLNGRESIERDIHAVPYPMTLHNSKRWRKVGKHSFQIFNHIICRLFLQRYKKRLENRN